MGLKHIDFAIENQYRLEIKGKNNSFPVFPFRYDENKLYFKFENSDKTGSILWANLSMCELIDEEAIELFSYLEMEEELGIADLAKKLTNLKSYYMAILEEAINTCKSEDDKKLYEYKMKLYISIFQNLYKDSTSLLMKYFLAFSDDKLNDNKDPILLISQSNISQKNAIIKALENQISVIEGPPGTGKTQTIISLIANCIVRNKKILVVSKNNSAIDNVIEKLDKIAMPTFYIRLGNKGIMQNLIHTLNTKLEEYKNDLVNIHIDNATNDERMYKNYELSSSLEEKINDLQKLNNIISELENQLRFLDKRKAILNDQDIEIVANYIGNSFSDKRLIKIINFLVKVSSKKERKNNINIIHMFVLEKYFRINYDFFKKYDVVIQWYLENIYIHNQLAFYRKKITDDDLDCLKKQVHEIYNEEYCNDSIQNLKVYLKEHSNTSVFKDNWRDILHADKEMLFKNNIRCIKNLFPAIFTTVDAALYNFKNSIGDVNDRFDYIIMDESSQCDILSALPIMSLAKNIAVVGDCQQLQAITNSKINSKQFFIDDQYDYTKESFMSSIKMVFHPKTTFLAEHYRCKYEIINYCNRYYYNNQLLIHTNHDMNCLEIINADKGKYATVCGSSFMNEREIVTIDNYVKGNEKEAFIITPFNGQAKALRKQYDKNMVGTIHTFQGREEKLVFFSSVMNDLDFCKKHIQGKHNLFYSELINVAVSRAIEQFILVADTTFFNKMKCELTNLIDYIHIYGKEIPDTTTCIFDHLYKEIKVFNKTSVFDSVWEKELKKHIDMYLLSHPEYKVQMKMYLASVVTDKKYLRDNLDINKYILNGAHLDFTIIDVRINKPVLVIELDGKGHDKEEQKRRDRMKDVALEHMGIKMVRLPSKRAISKDEFIKLIDMNLLSKR